MVITVILILLLTMVCSFIGTVSGFGISTTMIPILTMVLPLPQVLLFVGVVHWFNDVWRLVLFRAGLNWRLCVLFGIPGIMLSFVGASLLFLVDTSILIRALGFFIAVYVAFLFRKPSFKIPALPLTAIMGGGLSGFFAGIFGMGGIVRTVFLTAFDLPKEVYLTTGAVIALIVDSTRLVNYVVEEVRLEVWLLWTLFVAIFLSLVAARIAKVVVDKIPQEKFRLVVGLFLFLVALKLLIMP